MPTEVRIQAGLHPAQLEVFRCQSRFRVLSAGRRFGKTRLAGTECIYRASRGSRVWWVAPTYKVGYYGWRLISQICERIPYAKINHQDRVVFLPTGGEIWLKSADNPDSLRGEGLDFVVLEEASWLKPETWTNIVRPSLSDRKGSALFISTPNGRNWFFLLFEMGLKGADNWRSFKFSTYDNPHIDPAEIEEAKRELPSDIFQQEYMAEFLDLEGSLFRNVKACATAEPKEPEDRLYIGALDIATVNDWTVLVIFSVEDNSMVFLDRFRGLDYKVIVERIAASCRKYRLAQLVVEINGIGRSVADYLRSYGIQVTPFLTTNSSKHIIIQNLSTMLENEEIAILDHPALIGELLSFRSRRLPSGLFQYSAPADMHDDCVMALAMACWQLRRGRSKAEMHIGFDLDEEELKENGRAKAVVAGNKPKAHVIR